MLPKENAPEDGPIVFVIPKESLHSRGILIEEQHGSEPSIQSSDVLDKEYIPDITQKWKSSGRAGKRGKTIIK